MIDGRIFRFSMLFFYNACCFHRVVDGHSEVVEEKDGEVLCMLNFKFPPPHFSYSSSPPPPPFITH